MCPHRYLVDPSSTLLAGECRNSHPTYLARGSGPPYARRETIQVRRVEGEAMRMRRGDEAEGQSSQGGVFAPHGGGGRGAVVGSRLVLASGGRLAARFTRPKLLGNKNTPHGGMDTKRVSPWLSRHSMLGGGFHYSI
jgi:hypothetical protein